MNKIVNTWWARIYMAGDIDIAKQVCRKHAKEIGLCVNVSPTDYIYTGGQETGFIVELINYPRFPAETNEITEKAQELAEKLRIECCQHSYTIMTPQKTIWDTEREL